ncbi:hypothetical protein BP5796_03792 [Coleophoma crateriformis]|uniref:Roadblock/LAMTOR2 domain-containing protein n=1 Tax=Coleophoma crateriformis TaxID=565419 RepID=A0A3D8SGI3_9HELO|nr:hypothetical protein BP5796_03792 [Coleophoma crateriformis]
MLLIKRLTTFLNNNTSPQIHSLLLVTPTGKLLSSSSPLPISTLRTQATVACTLWSQYNSSQSFAGLIPAALPPHKDAQLAASNTPGQKANEISSILIQLEYGIMVISGLQSGLLLIAIGPSSSSVTPRSRIHSPEPASSPPAHSDPIEAHDHQFSSPTVGNLGVPGMGSGAPSETGSIATSVGSVSANIMALKRQTEELGKWLNGALEGFTLSSSDMR